MSRPVALADLLPSCERMSEWIQSTYDVASPDTKREGQTWYQRAHEFARLISPRNVERGAGVIAALSPQTSWSDNKRLARAAMRSRVVTGQTEANNAKAQAIKEGAHPLDVLSHDPRQRSHKTQAFYRLIVDPEDSHTVCVDRHALDVATLREQLALGLSPISGYVLNRVGGYALIADAYRHAAQSLGCIPHASQAVTWIEWRQTKRPNASSFTEPF